MFNLGFSNYKMIYEEDLYKDKYKNILCIWKDNGILIHNNVEKYIDINNKNHIKTLPTNILLITHNKDILKRINKDIIIYENMIDPIFSLLSKK